MKQDLSVDHIDDDGRSFLQMRKLLKKKEKSIIECFGQKRKQWEKRLGFEPGLGSRSSQY
jgi:hypothetical protein